MVDPEIRGCGLGKLMFDHSWQVAKESGYKGMQFNFVVSTNQVAVQLWKKLGFRIIGTIPNGFNHRQLGVVDAYIMFREID